MAHRPQLRFTTTAAALALLAGAHAAGAQASRPAPQPFLAPPPPSSSADVDVDARPPPDGIGLIITGSIFSGLAVFNAATSPVCLAFSSSSPDLVSTCVIASLVVAGLYAAVGVPTLLVGIAQHARVDAWHRQNPWTSLLDTVGVGARPGGATLSVRVAF